MMLYSEFLTKRDKVTSARNIVVIDSVFITLRGLLLLLLLLLLPTVMILPKGMLVRAFPIGKAVTSHHSSLSLTEVFVRCSSGGEKIRQGKFLVTVDRTSRLFSSSSTHFNKDDDDNNNNNEEKNSANQSKKSNSNIDSLFSDILMESPSSSTTTSQVYNEVKFNYDFDDNFEDDNDENDQFMSQADNSFRKVKVSEYKNEFEAADHISTEVGMNQPREKPQSKEVVKMKRPPPIMEYDYSHYDEEFGEAVPGEFGAADYIPPEILENQIVEDEEPTNIIRPSQHTSTVEPNNDKITRETDPKSLSSSKSTSPKEIISPHSESIIDEKNYELDSNNLIEKTQQLESHSHTETKESDKKNGPIITELQTTVSTDETLEFLRAAANGIPSQTMSSLPMQERKLEKIKNEIFNLNKNKKFNINSPRQVSKALFGVEGETTDKNALEALAATSTNVLNVNKAQMASLILQYRQVSRNIKRLQSNKKENSVNYRPTKARNEIAKNIDTFVQDRDPLLLLDASAFIFRSYYSMPPLHTADGTPVGAVLGFCNTINRLILNKLLNGERPRLALVYDSKTGSSNRKRLYEKYKANRKPCPIDLIPQFDIIKEASSAYGITQLECENWEADDVIATLATKAAYEEGCHVNILSGDKDLMQLITSDALLENENIDQTYPSGSIHMIDPMNSVRITQSEVIEKWGVPPHQLGDVLALAGDSSDNIPGVPGIGPKIASRLINEFGSLEALLSPSGLENIPQKGRRAKLEENSDLARLSRQLVELERNLPMESMTVSTPVENVSDIYVERFDPDRLLKFYDKMGFRDLKRKLTARLSKRSGYEAPSSSTQKPRDESPETIDQITTNAFVSSRKQLPPNPDDLGDVPF